MTFALGQDLLLLLSVAVAVGALLVRGGRHGLVVAGVVCAAVGTWSVSVSGSGGDVAAVRVKRVVGGSVRGVSGVGCRAGRVIAVQIIYEFGEKKKKKEKGDLLLQSLTNNYIS